MSTRGQQDEHARCSLSASAYANLRANGSNGWGLCPLECHGRYSHYYTHETTHSRGALEAVWIRSTCPRHEHIHEIIVPGRGTVCACLTLWGRREL